MGLFDRMKGIRRPAEDVVPVSAHELRERLLALNDPDVAWRVRDGEPEGVDLAGDLWGRTGSARQHLLVLMRLDEIHHEVQALDVMRSASASEKSHHRGNTNSASVDWTIGRRDDGTFGLVRSGLNTGTLKNPLRTTVTDAGWSWTPRLRKP